MDEAAERRYLAESARTSRRDFLVSAGYLLGGGASLASLELCQPNLTSAATAIKTGGTLIAAKTAEAPSLDPQIQAAYERQRLTPLIYSSLMKYDAEMNPRPDLAESFEPSADGKRLVFKLRKGVMWHSPVSRELTADDVKFSYHRLLKESPGKAPFASIEDIQVLDPYTVAFQLKQPDAGLLPNMFSGWYGAIVNRETIEKHGDLKRVAVGTGPFVLEEWIVENETRLRKNPDYFLKGQPYLDRLVIKIVPDEANIVAGLRTGRIQHAILGDNTRFDSLQGEKNLTVYRGTRLGHEAMFINCSQPPFDKVPVRQAMSYAIDREELVKVVAGGRGVVWAPFPPGMKQWQIPEDKWRPYYKVDLDRAKRLLAEAGFPNGFKTKLAVIPTFPTWTPQALVIQANLKRIGIDVEVESFEYAAWVPRALSNDPKTWLSLTMQAVGTCFDPDTPTYRWYHSKALNLNKWNDPEADRLLEQGKASFDYATRKPIYDRLQIVFLERVPQIWTYVPELIALTQNNVKGYQLHPTTYFEGFENVWLER